MDVIEGISPAIAIEQYNPVKHSRSTVGTASEIYDYIRLLFAKAGEIHCPDCGNPCHQVLSGFQFGGSPKTDLSPKNLERQGFTQYVKNGKGCYEKTAGKGPRTIVNNSSS